jgi:hypothetical protein
MGVEQMRRLRARRRNGGFCISGRWRRSKNLGQARGKMGDVGITGALFMHLRTRIFKT